MNYYLQNLRTGETLTLHHTGTLIGTAEHAHIKTAEGGPYLAALAVRYPSGWAVHGLSDSPGVTFNRKPLQIGQQAAPKKSDLLAIGEERFSFVTPHSTLTNDPPPTETAPHCFAYIRNPDGQEECRAVDHDTLFGRL